MNDEYNKTIVKMFEVLEPSPEPLLSEKRRRHAEWLKFLSQLAQEQRLEKAPPKK